MNLRHNLPTLARTSLTLSSLMLAGTLLTACDSENNSAELARAVELEKLRANGTIIEEFDITNAQTRLKAGEKHQLTAIGKDSKGNIRDVTAELTSWESSDPSIATVSSKGLVTGVAKSEVNQGIVIITASTINDITSDGEISISDVAVSHISLKQSTPNSGNIHTCIDANIQGDVTYQDGYISLNTLKDMKFTLDEQTSAVITDNGTLYTSAAGIENTTVTSTIGDINGQLTVTADSKDLNTIDILLNEEITTEITLNIGERIQVNAQATLIEAVSKEIFDIDPSIEWQQRDTGLTGITVTGENKGTLLALKAGITELTGTCGGKEKKVVIEVKGDAKIEGLQITDTDDAIIEDAITLNPLKSVEVKLTALYDIAPDQLNVSEFAKWEVIGNDIMDIELMSAGTKDAYYKLTSTSASEGTVRWLITYDGIVRTLRIDIENNN